jgi:hypothetical protein
MHTWRRDCWVIIQNKVYDVTIWLDDETAFKAYLQRQHRQLWRNQKEEWYNMNHQEYFVSQFAGKQ